MKPDLEQELVRAVDRARLIVPGRRIGVAVSGGADSVALLRLLHAGRTKLGITLLVLHFDHKLRPDSATDAAFVADLARSLDLEIYCGEADVARVAAREKRNVEDAARCLRYDFFSGAVKTGRAASIAVAHTMDDQAETVLARVLRGSGPTGLSGIYPKAGAIIRPLLGVRRAELRKYLRRLGQVWHEDATNQDTARQRARIRATLVPLLECDFSPNVVEHLAHLADLSREETYFWSTIVENYFETLSTRSGEAVSIPIEKLLSPLDLKSVGSGISVSDAMRSLTERLVRRLHGSVRHGGRAELGLVHVRQVIRLAEGTAGSKRVELPGGVLARRDFGVLTFEQSEAKASGKAPRETQIGALAYHYPVAFGGNSAADVSVPELGTCFRLKVIDWPGAERETTMWRSMLDLDSLRQPLILRNWLPGDNYRPKGHRKRRKLKEMFLAARIPAGARPGWPVLESAGHVVWARGIDAAEEFCVKEGTKLGVLIEEREL